jgi:N-terminal acetyltransferase B complex catalytic subunit
LGWELTVNIGSYQYRASFYLEYCALWPDYSCVVTNPNETKIIAYGKPDDLGHITQRLRANASLEIIVMGKHEPPEPHPQHHGHVTALSISPPYRSLGLARKLMSFLEVRSGPEGWNTWFLDLFVRCNNHRAIDMYESLGYSIYRRVVG